MFLPPWHFLNGRRRKATQIYVATFFFFFFCQCMILPQRLVMIVFTPLDAFAPTHIAHAETEETALWMSRIALTLFPHTGRLPPLPPAPSITRSSTKQRRMSHKLSPLPENSPPPPCFSISLNAFITCFFFPLFFFFDWWMTQVSILLTTAKFKNTPAKISATASILYSPLIDVRSRSTLV